MKTREESREDAKQFRINEVMDRVRSAVQSGLFYIDAELDPLQVQILEDKGYDVEIISGCKRPGFRKCKIKWD